MQGVLLFLVLAVNSTRFRILHSYTLLLYIAARSYVLLVAIKAIIIFRFLGGGILVCPPLCMKPYSTYMYIVDLYLFLQISDLGLSEDVLPVFPSHKGARRRMIYTHEHGLVDVPSGLSWLFRTKPPFTKPLLWTVLREVSQKQSGREDESVYDFFARRLNKEVRRHTTFVRTSAQSTSGGILHQKI